MDNSDILYILEIALRLARQRKEPMLVYFITMAIVEAGGFSEGANDNRG